MKVLNVSEPILACGVPKKVGIILIELIGAWPPEVKRFTLAKDGFIVFFRGFCITHPSQLKGRISQFCFESVLLCAKRLDLSRSWHAGEGLQEVKVYPLKQFSLVV